MAAPIEQQVNGVERMLYMSSQCTNDGTYTLTVTFELGTDLNMDQVLVQNRVALAMPQLPSRCRLQGVSIKKKSPDILLVVNLFSPGRRYDDLYLSNYATIQIKDELLRLPGVGDITYLGQRDYSMRVWLDPEKMATLQSDGGRRGHAPFRTRTSRSPPARSASSRCPAGQQFQLTMSTLGRLEDAKQFGDIIVKTRHRAASRCAVLHARWSASATWPGSSWAPSSTTRSAGSDGQPSVGLAVFQLPGSNALDVADAIKKKMEELKKRFPQGLDYNIVYDTTPFIEQSIEEVFNTLRDAVILVAIVVLFFLQDWKAMILPMIDVPVSLVGTFAVMAAAGLHPEQPDAVRAGAGHRHRGR